MAETEKPRPSGLGFLEAISPLISDAQLTCELARIIARWRSLFMKRRPLCAVGRPSRNEDQGTAATGFPVAQMDIVTGAKAADRQRLKIGRLQGWPAI